MRHDQTTRPSNNAWIALIVIPIAIFGIVLGIQRVSAQANVAKTGPIPTVSLQNHSLGVPAITPRASMAAAGATGPHFTQADVVQYVAAHPTAVGSIPSAAAPTVMSVQFVTAKQASALLQGESIGLPDSAPVCVVQLKGTFASFAPPGISGPSSGSEETLVFDGQTGNLLIG